MPLGMRRVVTKDGHDNGGLMPQARGFADQAPIALVWLMTVAIASAIYFLPVSRLLARLVE
jgi:hypothetical protein